MLFILVTLSCGGTSSDNNTYIVQASTTTAPATPCTYKICPCSSDICRIRYDFTTNVLANQVVSSATDTDPAATELTTSQLKVNRVWKSLKKSGFDMVEMVFWDSRVDLIWILLDNWSFCQKISCPKDQLSESWVTYVLCSYRTKVNTVEEWWRPMFLKIFYKLSFHEKCLQHFWVLLQHIVIV